VCAAAHGYFCDAWLERSAIYGLQGGCLRVKGFYWWLWEDRNLNVRPLILNSTLLNIAHKLILLMPQPSPIQARACIEGSTQSSSDDPNTQPSNTPIACRHPQIPDGLTRRITPLPALLGNVITPLLQTRVASKSGHPQLHNNEDATSNPKTLNTSSARPRASPPPSSLHPTQSLHSTRPPSTKWTASRPASLDQNATQP
jgi:hypothetical protein